MIEGCPNESGYRSLFWKLLLNYLPTERKKWESTLDRRRNEYREFVREMIIRPGYKDQNEKNDSLIDHVFFQYFLNQKILKITIEISEIFSH